MAAAHRRRQPWVPAATGALVRAVGEHPLLPMLMSSTTAPNREAWREVGRSMGRHGLGRTPGQLRGKWKALKVAFHSERAHRARHQAPSSHPPALYAQMQALWDRAGRPQYRDRHHTVAMAQAAAEVAAAAAAPHQPPARRRRIRQVASDSSSSSSPSSRDRASCAPPGGDQQPASPQPSRQSTPQSSASVVEVPLQGTEGPVHPVEEQGAVVAGQAEPAEEDWMEPAGTAVGSPHAQQAAGASVLERAAATLAAWSEAGSGAWGAAAPSLASGAHVPAHGPPPWGWTGPCAPRTPWWWQREMPPLQQPQQQRPPGPPETLPGQQQQQQQQPQLPPEQLCWQQEPAAARVQRHWQQLPQLPPPQPPLQQRQQQQRPGQRQSPPEECAQPTRNQGGNGGPGGGPCDTPASSSAPVSTARGVGPLAQGAQWCGDGGCPGGQGGDVWLPPSSTGAAQGPRLMGRFNRLRRVVEATLGCHQVIQDQLVFLEGSARVALRTHQALERRVAQLEASPTQEAAAAEVIRLLQAAQGQAGAHLAALMAIMAQLGIGPPPPSPPLRPSRDCPRCSAHRDAPSTSRTQQ